jgi:hypothetical protein
MQDWSFRPATLRETGMAARLPGSKDKRSDSAHIRDFVPATHAPKQPSFYERNNLTAKQKCARRQGRTCITATLFQGSWAPMDNCRRVTKLQGEQMQGRKSKALVEQGRRVAVAAMRKSLAKCVESVGSGTQADVAAAA